MKTKDEILTNNESLYESLMKDITIAQASKLQLLMEDFRMLVQENERLMLEIGKLQNRIQNIKRL